MLYYQSEYALGSKAELTLNISKNSPVKTNEVYLEFWAEVIKFENQFSRFLESSELTYFNRNNGYKNYISKDFKDILHAAKHMSDQTQGIYNPFILPALVKAGYQKSRLNNRPAEPKIDYSAMKIVSSDQLLIGHNYASIPKDTAIDLGGIGKGYLADKLAHILSKYSSYIQGYWLSLGGDMILSGCAYQQSKQSNWKVDIQRAHSTDSLAVNKKQSIGYITIPFNSTIAVATSGITDYRGVKINGSDHHLIDPITQKSAKTDILLATITDISAMKADIYASCAVIATSKFANQLLNDHSIDNYLLQVQSESKPSIISPQLHGQLITITG